MGGASPPRTWARARPTRPAGPDPPSPGPPDGVAVGCECGCELAGGHGDAWDGWDASGGVAAHAREARRGEVGCLGARLALSERPVLLERLPRMPETDPAEATRERCFDLEHLPMRGCRVRKRLDLMQHSRASSNAARLRRTRYWSLTTDGTLLESVLTMAFLPSPGTAAHPRPEPPGRTAGSASRSRTRANGRSQWAGASDGVAPPTPGNAL